MRFHIYIKHRIHEINWRCLLPFSRIQQLWKKVHSTRVFQIFKQSRLLKILNWSTVCRLGLVKYGERQFPKETTRLKLRVHSLSVNSQNCYKDVLWVSLVMFLDFWMAKHWLENWFKIFFSNSSDFTISKHCNVI